MCHIHNFAFFFFFFTVFFYFSISFLIFLSFSFDLVVSFLFSTHLNVLVLFAIYIIHIFPFPFLHSVQSLGFSFRICGIHKDDDNDDEKKGKGLLIFLAEWFEHSDSEHTWTAWCINDEANSKWKKKKKKNKNKDKKKMMKNIVKVFIWVGWERERAKHGNQIHWIEERKVFTSVFFFIVFIHLYGNKEKKTKQIIIAIGNTHVLVLFLSFTYRTSVHVWWHIIIYFSLFHIHHAHTPKYICVEPIANTYPTIFGCGCSMCSCCNLLLFVIAS